MVTSLPQINLSDEVCSGNALGKHPKENFDKEKAWRDSKVLELAHSDVVGPFPSLSFNNAFYFLTLLMTFLDTLGSTFFGKKEKFLMDSRISRLM
jgi:hypothetical protein